MIAFAAGGATADVFVTTFSGVAIRAPSIEQPETGLANAFQLPGSGALALLATS